MAIINKELYARTNRFAEIDAESKAAGEDNDCGVKAVAVACNVSYADAHAALKEAGRIDKEATSQRQISDALKSLGFKQVMLAPRAFIDLYPGVHVGLKNITTHHPDRFKSAWQDGHSYLMYSKSHVGAVVDGLNHDWTRGSAKRVREVWAVVPLKGKLPADIEAATLAKYVPSSTEA